jgi:hypothetical protein
MAVHDVTVQPTYPTIRRDLGTVAEAGMVSGKKRGGEE